MSSISCRPSSPLHPPSSFAFPDFFPFPGKDTLYQAQSKAKEVVKANIFPCYRSEYVASQTGLYGKALFCYSKTYEGTRLLHQGFQQLVLLVHKVFFYVLSIGDHALIRAFQPVMDKMNSLIEGVFPINPVNGHRHFVAISRRVEKALGDKILFPLCTAGQLRTTMFLEADTEPLADKVDRTLNSLVKANGALLNPENEPTQFNYRAQTVASSQINAFATPGGGMVVFSQLVEEIHGALKRGKYKESFIHFADGSHTKVDLSDVKLEDVLAALLGHEMTHVASRHSIVSIVASVLRSAILHLGRLASVAFLKSRDKEYQALCAKRNPSAFEQEALRSKETFYKRLNDIFGWVEGKIKNWAGLFVSRKHEYEADATGAYFAYRAGFDPLGAIYLQEVLKNSQLGGLGWAHEHFEFLFSHPYEENRKRAIFAAINEIDPPWLQAKTGKWHLADQGYNMKYSSPAINYARLHSPR